MKQRLCVGVISTSSILRTILDSIGIWYEVVDDFSSLSKYPVLIVDGNPSFNRDEIKLINEYKLEDGALFEVSNNPIFYNLPVKRSFIKSILNTHSDTAFDAISHLDLYSRCALSFSSNLFEGLLDFQKNTQDKTDVGFLGLDLKSLPSATQYVRKRFLSHSEIQPDEIVNKVSYEALCDIIELSIHRLFHGQNLPFIKKWTSPNEQPIFGFRIDSDFGTKESIQKTYSFLEKHSIKATWFLHVKAHEDWLPYFHEFKNQELALHGYKHGYSNSFSKILDNIHLGLSKLEHVDIHPAGFCAPYAIWNEALRKSLVQKDFLYTSEFTAGYDCLPFFQDGGNNLQIPIHPICTGSLNRKQYSFSEMEQYFISVYKRKKNLFKPILFYHHPLQSGLEVFNEIFTRVNSDGLTQITLKEYAEFWCRRHQLNFEAYVDDEQISVSSNDDSLLLYISNRTESFDLISSKTQVIPNNLTSTFKYDTPSLPSENQFRRLKGNPLKLIKTSIVDWNNRQRL